ncbi:gluconate transport inducer 1/Pac2, partial [Blastocladiella britannica]
ISTEATHRGILPRTTRRLTSDEKSKAVYHGAIHVFVEGEAGIKRWTDKLHWSASRIAGQFLVSDLTMMGPPSSTTARSSAAAAAVTASATTSSAAGNSEELASESSLKPDTPMARKAGYSIKGDGLVKRTLSLVYRGITHHLVSYYDSRFLDSLPRPSNDPSLRDLDVDTNVTP